MTGPDVVVDATALGEAAARRGVGTFVRGLLGELGGRDDLSVRALVQDPAHLPPGIVPIRVSRAAPGRFRHHERDLRSSVELHRHRGDVAHGLDTEPPLRFPRPFVQTLFDVIPLVIDDPALHARRQRWRRIAGRFRRADLVVAISHHAASSGIEHLGLDPARVEIALLGVDRCYAPGGPVDARAERGPYVVFVGDHARRKGLAEACEVLDLLADAGLPHRLVVAGRVAPWHEAALERLVGSTRHRGRVEIAGYVDDLAALYRGASATVVTSRHEGFGFPAAESMASGTPVVAFANSALVEVVDGGGVLVTDGDVVAFADELASVLTESGRAEELSGAGIEHARRFRWSRCAAVHADLYQSLC